MKILYVPRPQIGSIIPGLPIVDQLIQQGHEVCTIDNPEFQNAAGSLPSGLRRLTFDRPTSPRTDAVARSLQARAAAGREQALTELRTRLATSEAGGNANPADLEELRTSVAHAPERLDSLARSTDFWNAPNPLLEFAQRDRRAHLLQNAWKFESGLETELRVQRRFLQEAALSQAAIEREGIDLVLADPLWPGGLLAAEAAGVPAVTLVHYLLDESQPHSWIYQYIWKQKDLSQPDGYVPDQDPRGFVEWWNRVRADFSLGPIAPSPGEGQFAMFSHHGSLLLTHPALRSAPGDSLPAFMKAVAPGAWEFGDHKSEAETARALTHMQASTGRPKVLMTASSTAHDFNDIIATAMRACDELGYELTVTAPATNVDPNSPDAHRIFGFVSHERLLPEADTLITPGGHGSAENALRHGVPMLVIPHRADTPDVARRVEAAGFGASLPQTEVTLERMKDQLRRVVENREAIAARMGRATSGQSGALDIAAACDLITSLEPFANVQERPSARSLGQPALRARRRAVTPSTSTDASPTTGRSDGGVPRAERPGEGSHLGRLPRTGMERPTNPGSGSPSEPGGAGSTNDASAAPIAPTRDVRRAGPRPPRGGLPGIS